MPDRFAPTGKPEPIPRGVPYRVQWHDSSGRLHTAARCYLLSADGGTRWIELLDADTGEMLSLHNEAHAPTFQEAPRVRVPPSPHRAEMEAFAARNRDYHDRVTKRSDGFPPTQGPVLGLDTSA